jgi:hypothetical protein
MRSFRATVVLMRGDTHPGGSATDATFSLTIHYSLKQCSAWVRVSTNQQSFSRYPSHFP